MAAKKGKGWHGNSEGHARAGRKGGLARGRNLRARKSGGVIADKYDENMNVNKEEKVRTEIRSYEQELLELRKTGASVDMINELEKELRTLQEKIDQASIDQIRELRDQVHELGNRINSLSGNA